MSLSRVLRKLASRVKEELTGRKLLWNLLFYLGHLAIFAYGWYKQMTDARLAGLNKLKYSVWISRGAGLCLGVDGLLIILPLLRNLIRFVRPVVGRIVPVDENIWFHRQIAYSILFWTIVHTTAHYVNMINVERSQVRKETAWAIMYTQPGGITGHFMLLLMFFMYTTAHRKIRKQSFEAFWYTHHLAFLFLIALYFHAIGCFVRGALPGQLVKCLGYRSWQWCIGGGVLYLLERLIRLIRSHRSTTLTAVLLHPGPTLELRFSKPSMSYKAGQWLCLNVPDVSKLQWHPFTISSAPDDPFISVHIRLVGDWTKDLAARLGCLPQTSSTSFSSSSLEKPNTSNAPTLSSASVDVTFQALLLGRSLPVLRVDGPFGAPAQDVLSNEVAVLIGAGIGVTPFASIVKDIWHRQQKHELGALRRVLFVWINREAENFEWFNSLLKNLEKAQTDPHFLTIQIYLTKQVDADTINNLAIHSSDTDLDSLTTLRAKTQYGRPKLDLLFNSMRQQIEQGFYLPGMESSLKNTVGVYYCGPSPLAKVIKSATKAAGSKNVKFSFAKEHFRSNACPARIDNSDLAKSTISFERGRALTALIEIRNLIVTRGDSGRAW
ncbi:hypothetical protein JCM5350_002838 [Sporobolomyces pararoseus]